MKILLIEDEVKLVESIQQYLNMEGHVCETAINFSLAHEKIKLYQYDCALVDLNLPDGNGLELVEILKSMNKKMGIIIITARDSIDDRIKGLEIGADDYIVKPFNLAELNARIKSLMRRINFEGTNDIAIGKILVKPNDIQVFVNDKLLDLTKKEYDLLLFFMANQKRVLPKETIAEHLWGDYIDAADSFNFVYSHIKNLRKKLADMGVPEYIQNVYGVGYKFQID